MSNAYRMRDRVVLVTGGGSGIGRATAIRLASEGAHVAVSDLNLERASQVAGEILTAGGSATATRLDVADRHSWNSVVASLIEERHRLDVLINNAGVTRDRTLLSMSDEEWDEVLSIHLRGTWLGCQTVLPQMREQRSGCIINTSSSGRHGSFGQVNYSAAKAAIVGLSKTVALEQARYGVRCNVISPGAINTPMTQAVPETVKVRWLEQIALNRLGLPEEIAAGIAFLASDDASYVTGHVLDINGGELHL